MKKLIELDTALEGLENLNAISFYEANEHSKEAYMETMDMLKALPTVDAVPVVHGRWVIGDDGVLHCSKCSQTPISRIIVHGIQIFDMTPVKAMMKYCPNCGAKMDGKEVDNGKTD